MAVAEPQLRTLTPEQVDQFHIDGYLAVHDLLTPDEVADLAEAPTHRRRQADQFRQKHPASNAYSAKGTQVEKPGSVSRKLVQPRAL